jgi:hypothetical protein
MVRHSLSRAFAVLAFVFASSLAFAEDCPVTASSGGMYGTDTLAAVLPSDGKFVFQPQGPGFIDRDGALGIKVGWLVKVPALLEITGRRLDGPAPRARAYTSYRTPYRDGDAGGQSNFLVFPTPGCWQIVASAGQQSLTFVVAVELIAPGPAGRMNGVPQGWRQTGG